MTFAPFKVYFCIHLWLNLFQDKTNFSNKVNLPKPLRHEGINKTNKGNK